MELLDQAVIRCGQWTGNRNIIWSDLKTQKTQQATTRYDAKLKVKNSTLIKLSHCTLPPFLLDALAIM